MENRYIQDDYKKACNYIVERAAIIPKIGIILGSGLGNIADAMDDSVIIPYDEIPNFPVSGAPGHAGELYVGYLFGVPTVLMKGRVHLYEGYHPQEVTFSIRVMKILGVEKLIVTNAAGGLNKSFQVGDLMVIRDHISLANLGGLDPMRGQNVPGFGDRFTSLNKAYDPGLIAVTSKVASQMRLDVKKGVYAHVVGPCFETPSEVRFLSLVGGDAVGMSTVPEVLVARHAGIQVLAISAITNMSIHDIDAEEITTEEEVWETVEKIVPILRLLVEGIIVELASEIGS